MNYMVVSWVENQWKIVHYSHSYADCCNQYKRLSKLYPNCIIMINIGVLHYEESRIQYKKIHEDVEAWKRLSGMEENAI